MIQERVLKSGRKSFMARAYGPDGRMYHKAFGTKRDAKIWLVREKVKKCDGDYIFTPNRITVDKYFNYYLDTVITRLEYGTYRAYKMDMKNHILPILGEKRMIDVSHDDGILLQKIIANKKLNPKTNNKILILFKQVLEYACSGKGERRVLDKNPLKGFQFLPIKNKEICYWDSDDIKYFLGNTRDNHYFDFYRVALNTGMRIGEIAALQPKKIDLKKNLLTVSHSLKPRREGGLEVGCTKNKTARHLKMNQTVREIMERKMKGKKEDEFLFVGRTGDPIDVYHFSYRKSRPLQKKIKMKKSLRFHDLRHTYASNFMMKEGNLFTLQKLLGHKEIKATQIYAHLALDYMQEAVDRIEY